MFNFPLRKGRSFPLVEKVFEQPDPSDLAGARYTKIGPRYTAWIVEDVSEGVVRGCVLDIPGFPLLRVQAATITDATRALVDALELETQRYLKACLRLGWQPAKRDQGAEVVHSAQDLISSAVVSDAAAGIHELVMLCEQKVGEEFGLRLALSVLSRETVMGRSDRG